MLCPSRVEFLKVTNSADASQLAEVVDCEGGGGSFVVQWMGRVAVEVTISVSNGTSLEITSLGTAGEALCIIASCVLCVCLFGGALWGDFISCCVSKEQEKKYFLCSRMMTTIVKWRTDGSQL